jgi:hypothetical protein
VAGISEIERDGRPAAKLVLHVNPEYIRLIPVNVVANIEAATLFGTESVSPPTLPAPTAAWAHRQPVLKRYVRWLVHDCGVTQVATARVLNSAGQRTPKGRLWQSNSVSALLNGRYDRPAMGGPR